MTGAVDVNFRVWLGLCSPCGCEFGVCGLGGAWASPLAVLIKSCHLDV